MKTTKYSSWVVPTRVKQVQDGGRQPSEKKSKIGYLRNGLTDLHEIRHSDANCASKWDRKLNFPTFENPKWRTAAILKIENLPYLKNGSTDLREIWHDDAYCAFEVDRKLKFPTIKNQRWRTAAILKNGKSAIEQYLLMRRLVRVKSAIHRVGKVELYATVSNYFTISPNKTAKIILKNKNWLQFLFIVKAAVLK